MGRPLRDSRLSLNTGVDRGLGFEVLSSHFAAHPLEVFGHEVFRSICILLFDGCDQTLVLDMARV